MFQDCVLFAVGFVCGAAALPAFTVVRAIWLGLFGRGGFGYRWDRRSKL